MSTAYSLLRDHELLPAWPWVVVSRAFWTVAASLACTLLSVFGRTTDLHLIKAGDMAL